MKRYIFFIGTLRNGGAERVVSVLASQMAEQGLDVEILMYYDKPVFYELSSKVKVTAVEKETGKKGKIQNLCWLRNYFKNNAKVVLSFLAPFNMLAIVSVFGTKVPMIVADRNDPTKVPSNILVRKTRDILYMFANGVVLQTEKNKSYFNKKVQQKSKVIYNPVDMKGYAGAALNAKKEKIIVTAGRLMPQKNQKLLIKAFSEISLKYPEYKMVIYGEGPSRTELESLIDKLGMQEKVILPGNVSDLHEQMKLAELFVMSSDYEGMPNALIEAMCLGLPVISTKVSGKDELVQKEKNGILVDCGNEKQLIEAMDELLENPERLKAYAQENVKLVEKLDIRLIVTEWTEFIDDMCKG